MDFHPTAKPNCLALREIRIHARIHHPFQHLMVHA